MLDLVHFRHSFEKDLLRVDKLTANAADASKDKDGSATSILSGHLRSLALSSFILIKDISFFRSYLYKSANVYLKLFERSDAGEPISRSYVSMLAYKELLDALASGDMALSAAFAQKMGERDALEKEYDVPFTIAFGYTLKYLVLDDEGNAKTWLARLKSLCEGKTANFKGYIAMITAIIHQDEAAMNVAIPALIEGHKKESKGQGMFSDLLDEYLAVWAIGLANLAKKRGLILNVDVDLIPKELVVELS